MRSLALLRALIDDDSDVKDTAYKKTGRAAITLYVAAIAGLVTIAPDTLPGPSGLVQPVMLVVAMVALAGHHYLLTQNTPASTTRHRLGAVVVSVIGAGTAALLYTGRLSLLPAFLIPFVASYLYKWAFSLWVREEIEKALAEAKADSEDGKGS